MNFKKIILTFFLIAAMFFTEEISVFAADASASASNYTNAESYSYQITPLLAPFNQFFLVKTENPDPTSFRFLDKKSVYKDDCVITSVSTLYQDVVYENEETKRVKGGYLFTSSYTDGGDIILQTESGINQSGKKTYQNTEVSFTLPKLVDQADYLIDTYAKGNTFFEKMDAVQYGFHSICLYSGSFIRGEVYRSASYWELGYGWNDQLFYIVSPYNRKGNKSLFASAIYPFRYDSRGFPSVMADVSQRLNSDSSYKWSASAHDTIYVTYNGKTKSYGGQGNEAGQGLSEDKITRFFRFDESETITLEDSMRLLQKYSAVKMPDDVPRDDELTFRQICNTVGKNGAWTKISNDFCYSFLYQQDDDYNFSSTPSGVGGSLYWGGSLALLTDAWVDGRYVDSHTYCPGALLKDHPESKIVLLLQKKPSVKYEYDWEYNSTTNSYQRTYKNIQVTESLANIIYNYNKERNAWEAEDYAVFAEMADQGAIDAKYADMLQLTYDEVLKLGVDRNTNIEPEQGYIYNGIASPGTRFDRLNILTQPANKTVMLGKPVTLSLQAEGVGLTYQWYYKKSGQTSFNAWNGHTHATETCTPNASWDGIQLYCIVKDNLGRTVQSNTVRITVTQAIKITAQPTDKTITLGDSVTLSLKAQGAGLTYQWYYKKTKQTSFSTWNGRTHTSETCTPNATWDGIQLYCIVKDSAGNKVQSNTVTVMVNSAGIAITQQPQNQSIIAGKELTLSVKVTGSNLKYQWYYKKKGQTSFNIWNGRTHATETVSPNNTWDGIQLYCKITDGSGKTLNSSTVTISVLSITTQPSNVTIATGSNATFKVVATGSGLKYQWQYKKSGQTSWNNWGARTTASTTATSNSTWNGMQVRCIVTDSAGNKVTSNAATITIK